MRHVPLNGPALAAMGEAQRRSDGTGPVMERGRWSVEKASPGTLQKKVDACMRPLYNALYDMLDPGFWGKGNIDMRHWR